MCLKLVKQLDSIDRLPINHTIFTHVVQKEAAAAQKEGRQYHIKDASVFLFGEFERVQKEAHMQENPQNIDPDSGLPYCVFHNDRVEHFYCEAHKVTPPLIVDLRMPSLHLNRPLKARLQGDRPLQRP